MIDAVGLDVGHATAAAACRRGDEVEPALVVPTADLGGVTLQERLAALAAQAAGSDARPRVAVVVAPLTAAAQAEVDTAARAAFADPLMVRRPLAVARWFTHTNELHPDAVLVVVEAEPRQVAVTAVRSGPGGLAIARPASGEAAAGPTDVVDAVAAAVTAWGLTPRDTDVAVIVGGAPWLPALPAAITLATGLAALVDREPLAAAACGAALLVRGPVSRAGAALAVGVPVAGTALRAAPEGVAADGGAVAAAAGEALGEIGDGGGVAAAASTALRGAKHRPPKRWLPKRRPRTAGRPKAAMLLAPLAVTLALGALLIRASVHDPDTADLVTSPAPGDPSDPAGSVTTLGPHPGSAPKGTPGTSTTTTTSRAAASPRQQGTVPPPDPGAVVPAPAPPAPPPDVPPRVAELARTAARIDADTSGSPTAGRCNGPQTTQLSATVTDASGLASVRVVWSTPRGHGGTIGMARGTGDVWTATLGPVADAQMTISDSTPVAWSVEAADPAGHTTTVTAGRDAAVTLSGCVIG
jgi:hypothetical protein